MAIINGLEINGEQSDGGKILDPDSGEFYQCELCLESGNLLVRGYILFFFEHKPGCHWKLQAQKNINTPGD